MSRAGWNWAAIILLSSAAVCAVILLGETVGQGVAAPLRPLLVFWFILVCPGMAWVRLLDIRDPLSEGLLAVTVSVTLTMLLGTVMVYTNAWNPVRGLALLVVFSVIGVLLGVRRAPHTPPARAARCPQVRRSSDHRAAADVGHSAMARKGTTPPP